MRRSIEDYLRLAEIGNRLRGVFELWGYREMTFPAIEEYSPEIRKGTKLAYDNTFYLLNPDPTSRIMRAFSDESIRLFYITEVLTGSTRGEWQAGVEMIGFPKESLVEPIIVAITALEALGIEEFYIDIGSLEVWRRATEGIEEFRGVVFNALVRRNFEPIDRLPIPGEKKEELWRLFNFRGRKSGFEKLDWLLEVVDDERVFVDLGTVRPQPYYTDIIFEIYSPEVGKPIGGGGEYLVNGKPAAGFYLDMAALSRLYTGKKRGRTKLSLEDPAKAYREAKGLVKLGIPVEVER